MSDTHRPSAMPSLLTPTERIDIRLSVTADAFMRAISELNYEITLAHHHRIDQLLDARNTATT